MRRDSNPFNAVMGQFLGGYPWAHFLTLTFKPLERPGGNSRTWGRFTRRDIAAGVSDDYAMRSWRSYLGKVEADAEVPLFWFYGLEHGEVRGRLHVHALTGNTERLPVQLMRDEWGNGFSRILSYDPNLGAAHYVSKYVTKQLAEWDISGSVEDAVRSYKYRGPTRATAQRLTMREQGRHRERERSRSQLATLDPSTQFTFSNWQQEIVTNGN